MIRSNLAVLLAERKLKITKVSMETGISRTTLTALCNNTSQGVLLDTVDVLCSYLKVSPSELISHIPVYLAVDKVEILEDIHEFDFWSFSVLASLSCGDYKQRTVYALPGFIDLRWYETKIVELSVMFRLPNEYNHLNENDSQKSNAALRRISDLRRAFLSMDIGFLDDFEETLSASIQSALLKRDTKYIFDSDLTTSFEWPQVLNKDFVVEEDVSQYYDPSIDYYSY